MSAAANPANTIPVSGRFNFRDFRLIPRIETYPRVLAFAQTIVGKTVLVALFGIALYYSWYLHYPSNPRWKVQIAFIAVMTAFPRHRRILLTVCSLLWALGVWWRWADHSQSDHWQLLEAAISIAIGALLFWSARRFRTTYFGRRPVATLLTGFTVTLLIASYLPRNGSLWTTAWNFLPVFGTYLWFIAYSLIDATSKRSDPASLQIGTYQPFWGSTPTPIAKGAAYLRRIEAQNAEQLAIAQLKGLKLLAWAIFLDVFLTFVYVPFVHGYLGIPLYEFVFNLSVQRVHFSFYTGWASLIAEFFERMIDFTISGHRIIAICRMAGFLALRNTYRPLASRSIAEFWNRYYYYFKELLVDCFFYPTFTRYFKGWGRWRVFAATVAAAGFGNAFYHFVRDLSYIRDLGFWKALWGFQSYIFYTIVLSVGIGISQMQMKDRNTENLGWVRRQLIPAISVTGFFCLLRVFDYTYKRFPLDESFRFLGHLFNLVS